MSGQPLLLLYLDAPLQSWGTRSRWDTRDSGREPSKSGIIGLLACAFGYRQGDLRIFEIANALTLGVRADEPGVIEDDFQTILPTKRAKAGYPGFNIADVSQQNRKLPPGSAALNPIISRRQYLHDAIFLVAMAGERAVLETCHDALLSPTWPIYLGRKCCVPARPVIGALTDKYGSVEDALRRHPRLSRPGSSPATLHCSVEDVASSDTRPDNLAAGGLAYLPRHVRIFDIPSSMEVA